MLYVCGFKEESVLGCSGSVQPRGSIWWDPWNILPVVCSVGVRVHVPSWHMSLGTRSRTIRLAQEGCSRSRCCSE